jgi:hypothetical protein
VQHWNNFYCLKIGLNCDSLFSLEVLQEGRLTAHGCLELEAFVEIDGEVLRFEKPRNALNKDPRLLKIGLICD